jgi:hypothetical protein
MCERENTLVDGKTRIAKALRLSFFKGYWMRRLAMGRNTFHEQGMFEAFRIGTCLLIMPDNEERADHKLYCPISLLFS